MFDRVSPELERRLTAIAEQRNCTLEELLTEFADQHDHTDFPGDPYRFFELSVALICVADLQGNLLYVNPSFYNTLGYEKEELLHQPYANFVHPEDRDSTNSAEARLHGGDDMTHFENRYRCKDGSYRWLSWASTLHGERVYGVALDVTEQKTIEQQLAHSLEQNERILSTMFDGYLLGDRYGNILDVNSAYCGMVGYTRDELLGMKFGDLSAAGINGNMPVLVANDPNVVVETQQKHKAGALVDVEINTVQLPDGQIACFIRDITGRKQLEQRLRHSEQLYRGLIESQIDLVCRYTPDTTLTYVNDAYCRFFRRQREDLLGNQFLQQAPGVNRSMILARINEVTQNPAPDVRILHTYNEYGEKVWIQWVDYGLTDETGAVVEIQAVGRDVTALVTTQERLREREEMLSTIFNNIPLMLAQINPDGVFEYVNRHWEEVLGWTFEEMQAHPNILAEFYPDPAEQQRALAHMQSGNLKWADFKTHTRDGQVLDTSWMNVPLTNGRTLGIGQVITQRVELENQRIYAKQLEGELEKERALREMKDHFVSIISHEFRTPLAVMSTSLDFVLRYFDRLSTERVLSKLGNIQKQIGRMVELMEDALRYSRSRAGKTEFEPQDVDILPLLESIIETMKQTDDLGHPINLLGVAGTVHADQRLLEHIFINLLSNAIKYSPEATPITVTFRHEPGHWTFSVKDEGLGIPEDDLSKLFEPFHRAHNARDLPGTGLGLSIVKDYVEAHGGDIHVKSEVGLGTTFWFTLPEKLELKNHA